MENNTYNQIFEEGIAEGITREKLRVLGLIREYIENDEADLDDLIQLIASE